MGNVRMDTVQVENGFGWKIVVIDQDGTETVRDEARRIYKTYNSAFKAGMKKLTGR